jgi:hypothetical protein
MRCILRASWNGAPVLDDVRWWIMATPFINLVGVAILIAKKVASG